MEEPTDIGQFLDVTASKRQELQAFVPEVFVVVVWECETGNRDELSARIRALLDPQKSGL